MAGQVAALVALAVLVETVVDVVKGRFPVPGSVAAYLWPCLAFGLGIYLAFVAQVGLSGLLPVEITAVWADRLLAGFIIGGGASTIYDWLDRKS